MLRCTRCAAENDASRRYCKECGTLLTAACEGCGAANEPDARFCGQCGEPLAEQQPVTVGGEQAAHDELATHAERRLVSVLFADLVGFTPFSEERDAEEVRETLGRYFDIARETVARYGGTVEKFIGDAVMAVWGTPIAQEDDAERAVRAGLDLVGAVKTLSPEVPAIAVRVGILTGEVAASVGGSNQAMVVGDIVNTASRLQSFAEPGTVIVGEATRRAAEAAIVFERIGDATLKGKASLVTAFRALRVVAERGGRNRSDLLEAPFVGRDEELRTLKAAFHAAERERKPRLVSVVGPAGIGKSRLAWEFEKYLDGVMSPVWWHAGHSPSYGDGITFWALGEMIRARAGLAEADDEPTTRARIGEMVARHVTDENERRWIEPALLTLLGIGAEPGETASSEQLFAAWRTFFERLGATGTVVLLFENFQWADVGTVEFIDHLLEWAREQPILVVTLARPEMADRFPTGGVGKRQFSSIYLEALPEAAMRELLSGLVPGLPTHPARTMVARADGVPLYAVETVRMLVSEGRLLQTDAGYTPSGDLADLAIPDSLTALIGARLDALDPADRSLVQDASVLGQSFTVAALAAVSGKSETELAPLLDGLVRRELITRRSDPRAADRGQYAFIQSLVREVAYRTLARRDRKTRHLAAARHFESLPTEELAGALATQYLAAHASAGEGAEADALAAQARVALKAAAERALRLGAPDHALSYLEQALTVTSEAREEAELAERAGVAASLAGRHDAAERYLRRALQLAASVGDRRMEARATGQLGEALLSARDVEASLTVLREGSERFADLAEDPAWVLIESRLARGLLLMGPADECLLVADRALAAAERAELPGLIADTLITKGTDLGVIGRPAEGVALLRAGAAMAEQLGDFRAVHRGRSNLAVLLKGDDPREGYESAREALALAQRLGMRGAAQTSLSNVVELGLLLGEWQQLRSDVTASLEEDLAPADRQATLIAAGLLRLMTGEQAVDIVAEAEALASRVTDPQAGYALGTLHAARAETSGQFSEAAAFYREGAEYAPEALQDSSRCALLAHELADARRDLETLVGSPVPTGRAYKAGRRALAAGIAALEGRTAESLAGHAEALRTFRELGLDLEVGLAGLQMATVLDPSLPDVAAVVEEAHAIFTRLGAKPYLALLDGAIASHASPAAEAEIAAVRAPEQAGLGR